MQVCHFSTASSDPSPARANCSTTLFSPIPCGALYRTANFPKMIWCPAYDFNTLRNFSALSSGWETVRMSNRQKNNRLPFFHKQNFNCNFWLLSPSFLVAKKPSPSLPVATVDPNRQSSKWWANWKRRSCFFFAQETSRRCTHPRIRKTKTSWGHLVQQHLRTLLLLKSTDLTSISWVLPHTRHCHSGK